LLTSCTLNKSDESDRIVVNLKYISIGTMVTLPSSMDMHSSSYRVDAITPLAKINKQSLPDLQKGMQGLSVDNQGGGSRELFTMSWKTSVAIGGPDKEACQSPDGHVKVRASGVSEVCRGSFSVLSPSSYQCINLFISDLFQPIPSFLHHHPLTGSLQLRSRLSHRLRHSWRPHQSNISYPFIARTPSQPSGALPSLWA
jgi:hypothetical protein